VVLTIGLLAMLVDRYVAEAFLRDHAVRTQAVITDKAYTGRLPRAPTRPYYLAYRFLPVSEADHPAGSGVEAYEAVTQSQYTAARVGQTVTVQYNPERLSQSAIYFAPPPTDRQIIVRDMLVFGAWLVLFGGICEVIVGAAWPGPPAPAGRLRSAWGAARSRRSTP
jgi:hypothetical protein